MSRAYDRSSVIVLLGLLFLLGVATGYIELPNINDPQKSNTLIATLTTESLYENLIPTALGKYYKYAEIIYVYRIDPNQIAPNTEQLNVILNLNTTAPEYQTLKVLWDRAKEFNPNVDPTRTIFRSVLYCLDGTTSLYDKYMETNIRVSQADAMGYPVQLTVTFPFNSTKLQNYILGNDCVVSLVVVPMVLDIRFGPDVSSTHLIYIPPSYYFHPSRIVFRTTDEPMAIHIFLTNFNLSTIPDYANIILLIDPSAAYRTGGTPPTIAYGFIAKKTNGNYAVVYVALTLDPNVNGVKTTIENLISSNNPGFVIENYCSSVMHYSPPSISYLESNLQDLLGVCGLTKQDLTSIVRIFVADVRGYAAAMDLGQSSGIYIID